MLLTPTYGRQALNETRYWAAGFLWSFQTIPMIRMLIGEKPAGVVDKISKASEILGETHAVGRVGYTINSTKETLTVDRDWNAPGVQALAGTLNLRDYGWFIDDLKLGHFIAINDVDTDPHARDAAFMLKGRSTGSFVDAQFIEHDESVVVIFVNKTHARNWTA